MRAVRSQQSICGRGIERRGDEWQNEVGNRLQNSTHVGPWPPDQRYGLRLEALFQPHFRFFVTRWWSRARCKLVPRLPAVHPRSPLRLDMLSKRAADRKNLGG